MTSPLGNNGEHAESLEYLNEYGSLIVDVSQLVNTFETQNVHRQSETTFQFYAVDSSFDIPVHIEHEIGKVSSANITFSEDVFKSLSIELLGETGTYSISRSEDPELENKEDTLFRFAPLSVVDQTALKKEERMKLPRVLGDGDDFENQYENIPGISSPDLLSILMQITHPSISLEPSLRKRSIPHDVDIFHPEIYASLIESSRITSITQIGHLHYELLSRDSTTLTYFFEAGQPESFHITTIDDVTGAPLKVTGQMIVDEEGRQSMSLQSPQKATSPGGEMSPDFPIDSVLHTAPTLRELKMLRETVADEILSLQGLGQQQGLDAHIVDAETIAVTTDLDDYVEAKMKADEILRDERLEDRIQNLIITQRLDDEN